jgi:hypothetical protein
LGGFADDDPAIAPAARGKRAEVKGLGAPFADDAVSPETVIDGAVWTVRMQDEADPLNRRAAHGKNQLARELKTARGEPKPATRIKPPLPKEPTTSPR